MLGHPRSKEQGPSIEVDRTRPPAIHDGFVYLNPAKDVQLLRVGKTCGSRELV